nr:Down syndrome cell adhesion molecule-like protein Dscam2 [Parasteatoda tepidariorum]
MKGLKYEPSLLKIIFTVAVIYIRGFSFQETPVIQPFAFPEQSTAGKTIAVICAVSQGSGSVQFSWLMNGKDISEIPNTSVLNQPGFSVLTIEPASKDNVGNYTCVAKNAHSQSSFTAGFILNGEWKPIISQLKNTLLLLA